MSGFQEIFLFFPFSPVSDSPLLASSLKQEQLIYLCCKRDRLVGTYYNCYYHGENLGSGKGERYIHATLAYLCLSPNSLGMQLEIERRKINRKKGGKTRRVEE